jgi:acetyl esterase/lipase
MYISDPAKRTDVHASPLRASLEQLKGLPPALIQVAENDIPRDEVALPSRGGRIEAPAAVTRRPVC